MAFKGSSESRMRTRRMITTQITSRVVQADFYSRKAITAWKENPVNTRRTTIRFRRLSVVMDRFESIYRRRPQTRSDSCSTRYPCNVINYDATRKSRETEAVV